MQATVNTYLKYIDLVLLENWSVQGVLNAQFNYSKKYEQARIGDFLIKSRNIVNIKDEKEYKRVTVKINNKGVLLRNTEKGINIGTKKQYRAKAGQFIVSKIDARNGAFGIIPNELDNAIVTNDFPLFDVNTKKINSQFLLLITTTKVFIKFAQSCSSGTTNRQRMDIDLFLNQRIPLPKLKEQNKIVSNYFSKIREAEILKKKVINLTEDIEKFLFQTLGLAKENKMRRKKGLHFTDFRNIKRWDLSFLLQQDNVNKSIFPIVSYGELFLSLKNGIPARNYTANGIRFLKVSDIKQNYIDNSNVKFIEKFKSSDLITKNTLLITRKGTVGNSIYIRVDKKYTASSEIFIIKLSSIIDGGYLAEINLSEFVQKQYIEKNTGTIMPSLSQDKLKEILIPLPTLEKQKKISNHILKIKKKVTELMALSNKKEQEAYQEFEETIFIK